MFVSGNWKMFKADIGLFLNHKPTLNPKQPQTEFSAFGQPGFAFCQVLRDVRSEIRHEKTDLLDMFELQELRL